MTGARLVLALGLSAPPAGRPPRFAPYPAPEGFRWEFVTADGVRVTSDGAPVVALVEIV